MGWYNLILAGYWMWRVLAEVTVVEGGEGGNELPQYWPVSCVMALSSITLFLGTSCYIKLSLMVAATVAYNVLCYVISGHVLHDDNVSAQ